MSDTVVPLEGRAAARRKAASGASLDPLHGLVADDLRAVNGVILDNMQSSVMLISELAAHIVAAGGKRLRPMMTLGSARLCGYTGKRHIDLAACVEFIHTATLLHDDVVDDSALRRGTATANAVWGNKPSVLVGDFLFSRAFQISVADGSLRVLGILADTAATLAEGEVMQLTTSNDTETSEAAYMKVVTAKTAALFAAACQLGAVVAERSAAEEEALRSFGLNLGIAYQLVDDALDYGAREAVLGKSVGDDFREGKITLPVVLAFRRGDDEERAFLAAHHGGRGAGRRRLRACNGPADPSRRDRRLGGAGAPLQRHGPRRARSLPSVRGEGRPARRGRFLHRPGALRAGSLEVPFRPSLSASLSPS